LYRVRDNMHHFMVSVAVRSSGRRTAQVEEMFASFLGAVVQEVREGRGLGNPTNFSSMILRINMSSASSLGSYSIESEAALLRMPASHLR